MTTTQAFADRVARVPCAACGTEIDVGDVEPLANITCPRCRADVIVPGVVGTLVLKALLGRGTAGIVYHAFDHQLGKDVAVKVFLKTTAPETNNGSATVDVVEKCLTEARAMRALTHPNIVQIYKVAQKGERPFIVMELLTGDRLDKVIDNHLLVEEHRALRMAIDVASGLKAVHDAGFAHLDVKPANIQMDGDGVCKLMDYDTARSQRQIEEQGAGLVGTPYYVAPEIIRRGAVDFRADMYSLGATMFHLIAQRPPFQGDTTRDVVQERLKRRAINLRDIRPDVSEETAAVIGRMLEAEPADRYANYDLLLADLRKAQQRAVDRALQPNAARIAATSRQSKPISHSTIAAAAAVVMVILIVVLVMLLSKPKGDDKEGLDGSQYAGGKSNATASLDQVTDKDGGSLAATDATKDATKNTTNDQPKLPPKDSGDEKEPSRGDPSVVLDPAETKDKAISPPVEVIPPKVVEPLKPDPVKPDPVKATVVRTRNEKEVDGWLAGKEVTLTHKPGLLTIWATGKDPSIRLVGLKGAGNSPEPSILEIRLKATGEGQGKLWWLSEKFPLFSDTRIKTFSIAHDGEWHDYIIPVHAKGDRLELRLELGAASGIFEIQWIKFFANGATDTRPTQQWRFEE